MRSLFPRRDWTLTRKQEIYVEVLELVAIAVDEFHRRPLWRRIVLLPRLSPEAELIKGVPLLMLDPWVQVEDIRWCVRQGRRYGMARIDRPVGRSGRILELIEDFDRLIREGGTSTTLCRSGLKTRQARTHR